MNRDFNSGEEVVVGLVVDSVFFLIKCLVGGYIFHQGWNIQ